MFKKSILLFAFFPFFSCFFLTSESTSFSCNHKSFEPSLINFIETSSHSLFSPEKCLISYSLISSEAQTSPLWWEIKILICSVGTYDIYEQDKCYSGKYNFIIFWKGSIEKDEEDFILYYENSELPVWNIQETANLSGNKIFSSTNDFQQKPILHVNYILKKGDKLHFNFIVHGFFIPKNESEKKYYLNLPASAEYSDHSMGIDYNSHILKGSNLIIVENNEIYGDSIEKIFSWRWASQKFSKKQKKFDRFSNKHDVKIKINITSHYE